MKQQINSELLKNKLEESGLKKNFIADKLSISRSSLDNKLSGKTPFEVHEALKLKDIVGIDYKDFMTIFLGLEFTKSKPQEEL